MTLFGRPFRPRLGTSIAALSMLAVLLGLGTWQLVRLEWKQSLINERQLRWQAPALMLPQDLSDQAALVHRKVVARGHYPHDRELYLPGRSYKGTAGVGIVTPFVLEDGRTLMVYRGWVPEKRKDPQTRPKGNPEGEIEVAGVLLPGGWHGSDWFQPENAPERNAWFFVDPAQMAAAVGAGNAIAPLYLGLYRDDAEANLPFTAPPPMDLRNDHLQYVITWYALAIALIVIYVVFHLDPQPKRRGGEA